MSIDTENLSKKFGDFTALQDVTLSIGKGELVALLGPSGSGKTTLLRMLAGLDFPDAGDIRFHGKSVLRLSARERGIGFVFQHYALFRHMRVFDNIAFGLKVRPSATRPSRAEIAKRVNELLHLIQLDWVADRYPGELSGGQRQRVALARALAIEPQVMLLDEPFGALDAKVRKELRGWLRRLVNDLGMTSVFVTHDQEEAMEVAGRVVIMNNGRIEQIGAPEDVYRNPASAFVLEFLGGVNKIVCEVRNGQARHPSITLDQADKTVTDGRITAFIRPQDIVLSPSEKGGGIVRHIVRTGQRPRIEVELTSSRELIEVLLSANAVVPTIGSLVTVSASSARLYPA